MAACIRGMRLSPCFDRFPLSYVRSNLVVKNVSQGSREQPLLATRRSPTVRSKVINLIRSFVWEKRKHALHSVVTDRSFYYEYTGSATVSSTVDFLMSNDVTGEAEISKH